MKAMLRGLAVLCGLAAMAGEANAQLFPKIRARLEARQIAPNSPSYYPGVSTEGYMPMVTDIGRTSGVVVEGGVPANPFQIPSYADGFNQRIRVITDNGFYANYYNTDPTVQSYMGFNSIDLTPSQYYANTAWGMHDQNARRRRWGYATGTTRRIGDGFQPLQSWDRSASGNSTGSTSRNSSASTSARNMQMFNSIMANSNAQIQAINNRSSAFRASSNAATSNLGASLRSSMSGSSGGGGGSGYKVFYDDNAPGKKR